MAKPAPGTTLQQQVAAYGIDKVQRHLLLCAGPDCVDLEQGEKAWAYLKRRHAELKLSAEPNFVFRTRCHCLRVCMNGPILVVQPDGVWYHSATPEVIERILVEHVLGGKVVPDFVIAQSPLLERGSCSESAG